MKKIVASVGLVALSATGLQTASAQDVVGPDTSKPWSIAATLRGFYDDNPATAPNDLSMDERDSFGFEVSPEFALAWSMQQTTINLGLMYSLRYYDTLPKDGAGNRYGFTDHDDQVFSFNVGLAHEFNEQIKVRVADSFVIGQEPDILRAGDAYSTFYRASGDNIRNHASLGLDAQLSPKIGLGFGYDNALYDYDDEGERWGYYGGDVGGIPVLTPGSSASATLDRMEQRVHLEGNYLLGPETKGLLGYQFTDYDYTGDEAISGYRFNPSGPIYDGVYSDDRNSREHTVYLGGEHNFTPQLTGKLRVGGSYSDYYEADEDAWTPYVNAEVGYTYAQNSVARLGFSYDRNATEVLALDAESAVVFLWVNHQIDPRLFLNLNAQFQNSLYNEGPYDDECDQYYLAGLNLEYRFNRYLSAHVGYNYDRLESDSSRTFDRNRVYLGVTARY